MREADWLERLERRVWRNFDLVIYPSEEEAAVVREMSPQYACLRDRTLLFRDEDTALRAPSRSGTCSSSPASLIRPMSMPQSS